MALAVGLCSAASMASCGERVVERHATVTEARRAGVFARGWLPDILPDTATGLVALYDLDTNARCAGARFDPRGRAAIRGAATTLGFAVYPGARPGPPFKGCPFLVGNVIEADEVLRRDGGWSSEFLILTADGQMYFWSN